MGNNVSKEQIKAARCADIYAFLTKHHNSGFVCEGDSIRPKNNHSISIRKGYNGYKDFATGETGNSIEFLTNHMGYTFVDAVQALSNGSPTACSMDTQQNGIKAVPAKFPEPVDGKFKNLFAYLLNRGISVETIQMLVGQKIMYQERVRNNIVFINMERDFAELRGTYTFGKPFHGIVPGSRHDGFWWFRNSPNASKCYICEAAIDAISLYELHKMQGNKEEAYYISIAGVAKQPAIDRLKKSKYHLVISVDNDDAGQQCRDRNPGLEYILPKYKDWNEDLQAIRNKHIAAG
ncbi:MAG: DUF3991 domain-containing protein [Lachnospiraceae bacterium]|nr:DUF3991 domain-containing protein [Lachnospiraceae bacterium]